MADAHSRRPGWTTRVGGARTNLCNRSGLGLLAAAGLAVGLTAAMTLAGCGGKSTSPSAERKIERPTGPIDTPVRTGLASLAAERNGGVPTDVRLSSENALPRAGIEAEIEETARMLEAYFSEDPPPASRRGDAETQVANASFEQGDAHASGGVPELRVLSAEELRTDGWRERATRERLAKATESREAGAAGEPAREESTRAESKRVFAEGSIEDRATRLSLGSSYDAEPLVPGLGYDHAYDEPAPDAAPAEISHATDEAALAAEAERMVAGDSDLLPERPARSPLSDPLDPLDAVSYVRQGETPQADGESGTQRPVAQGSVREITPGLEATSRNEPVQVVRHDAVASAVTGSMPAPLREPASTGLARMAQESARRTSLDATLDPTLDPRTAHVASRGVEDQPRSIAGLLEHNTSAPADSATANADNPWVTTVPVEHRNSAQHMEAQYTEARHTNAQPNNAEVAQRFNSAFDAGSYTQPAHDPAPASAPTPQIATHTPPIQSQPAQSQPVQAHAVQIEPEFAEADPVEQAEALRDQLAGTLEALAEGSDDPSQVYQSALRLAALEGMSPGTLDQLEASGRLGPDEVQLLRVAATLMDGLNPARGPVDADRFADLVMQEADRLNEALPLRITRAVLATRVAGFGQFNAYPMVERRGGRPPAYRFVAGRPARMIVYVEVDRFAREHTSASGHPLGGDAGGERWVVDLSQKLELWTDGLNVWNRPVERDRTESVNRVRDYYLIHPIELPANLGVGEYQLKVVMRDENPEMPSVHEVSIPIEIVSGGIAGVEESSAG